MSWPAMRGREDLLMLSLRRDGRIVNPAAQEALRQWLPGTTDCFVFCHGWLNDATEARGAAERFFARLDRALRPVREPMVPLPRGTTAVSDCTIRTSSIGTPRSSATIIEYAVS